MTRRGFTLVELIIVVAMILVLAGAMTSSVANARRRARLSRAQTDVREITNAILAYANYTEDGTLSQQANLNDAVADDSKLDFILGKGPKQRNSVVPVLYNAALTGGKILDPWGKPYRVSVKAGERVSPQGVQNLDIRLFYPNWHRLSEGERQ